MCKGFVLCQKKNKMTLMGGRGGGFILIKFAILSNICLPANSKLGCLLEALLMESPSYPLCPPLFVFLTLSDPKPKMTLLGCCK